MHLCYCNVAKKTSLSFLMYSCFCRHAGKSGRYWVQNHLLQHFSIINCQQMAWYGFLTPRKAPTPVSTSLPHFFTFSFVPLTYVIKISALSWEQRTYVLFQCNFWMSTRFVLWGKNKIFFMQVQEIQRSLSKFCLSLLGIMHHPQYF